MRTSSLEALVYQIDVYTQTHTHSHVIQNDVYQKIVLPFRNFMQNTTKLKIAQQHFIVQFINVNLFVYVFNLNETFYAQPHSNSFEQLAQLSVANTYILETINKREMLSGIKFHLFYASLVIFVEFENFQFHTYNNKLHRIKLINRGRNTNAHLDQQYFGIRCGSVNGTQTVVLVLVRLVVISQMIMMQSNITL